MIEIIQKMNSKIRIYVSLLFFIIVFYQLQQTTIISNEILVFIFIIAPIGIYTFVKYIFNKKVL